MRVITNNPLVEKVLVEKGLCRVEYRPCAFRDILVAARDEIHKGYRLLTHPLSGSVKPNETHYKSLGLSDEPAKTLDFNSLDLIEQSIIACDKFPLKYPVLPDNIREDFQLVDLTLILSVFDGNGVDK